MAGRFSAQTREKIDVGSHVIGKSRAIEGAIGTVVSIEGQGLNRKYFISWSNRDNLGANGAQFAFYPKRSFKLYSARDVPRHSGRPPAPPPSRYANAAAQAAAAASSTDEGSVSSEGSSSDDGRGV